MAESIFEKLSDPFYCENVYWFNRDGVRAIPLYSQGRINYSEDKLRGGETMQGKTSEKNLIALLVSRLSQSEIVVQGRTIVGQNLTRLSTIAKWEIWFREAENLGTSRRFLFRLACSNLRHFPTAN